MARRSMWMAVMGCMVLANAATAQPRDLPKVAIADFEVSPSGSTCRLHISARRWRSRESSNARDAQLAEATRQAVDAAAMGVVNGATRLTPAVAPGSE
jgi:hypothetical protein